MRVNLTDGCLCLGEGLKQPSLSHPSLHPFTHLPIHPPTHPIHLPIHVHTHPFISSSIYLPTYPSIRLPIHLHIYPSIHPPIYLSIHLLILPSVTPPTLSAHLSIWWSTPENILASYFVLDPLEGLSPCPLGAPSLGEKTETNDTSPDPHLVYQLCEEELGRRSPGKEPTAQPGIMEGFPGEESCQKASFLPCPPISSDPRAPTLCQAERWKGGADTTSPKQL